MAAAVSKPQQQQQQLYNPNQYSRRDYQPNTGNQSGGQRIRGCFWDGGEHRRDECQVLQKAIKRGDVHFRGLSLYLGQEGTEGAIRVPYPIMNEEGQVTEWQEEWVKKALQTKESKINSIRSSSSAVTLEEPIPDVRAMRIGENEKYICGRMNGQPMTYKPAKT